MLYICTGTGKLSAKEILAFFKDPEVRFLEHMKACDIRKLATALHNDDVISNDDLEKIGSTIPDKGQANSAFYVILCNDPSARKLKAWSKHLRQNEEKKDCNVELADLIDKFINSQNS